MAINFETFKNQPLHLPILVAIVLLEKSFYRAGGQNDSLILLGLISYENNLGGLRVNWKGKSRSERRISNLFDTIPVCA